MDRPIVYTQEQGRSTDFLFAQRSTMIGLSKLAAAMLGTNTLVNGLACTATSPASMQVAVGQGEIYSMGPVDATAYGVLAADTTDSILKQGISLAATNLSCPAPLTVGFSINYLVQAAYQDSDTNNVVLPYFNSANPSQPLNGQNNIGAPQPTQRQGLCVIQVKAGTAATTGTQTTPAADSGFTGLYVVTVAYGQATITSSSITQLSTAPILPAGVVQSLQSNAYSYAIDTGVANAYAATFSPAVTALTDGMVLRFKAVHANTGASTFSPNGLTPAAIVGGAHSALQGGEVAVNGDVWVQWNTSIGGGSWIMVDSTGGSVQVPTAVQSNQAINLSQVNSIVEAYGGNYALDTGAANAYAIALSPVITSYTNGQIVRFRAAHANTGASTLNAGGGVVSLKNDLGGALISGDIPLNSVVTAVYDSAATAFLINSLVPSQALSQTAADARYNQIANNLSDVANVATARTNLGAAALAGSSSQSFAVSTLAASSTVTISGGGFSAPSAGTGAAYGSASLGLALFGKGSTNDITLVNSAGSAFFQNPTGTGNVSITGTVSGANAASAGQFTTYDQTLGIGVTLTDVTASRVLGTTYTNSTSRPKIVTGYTINSASGSSLLTVDGNAVFPGAPNTATKIPFFGIVPPGKTYVLSQDAGAITLTGGKWFEA